MSTPSLDAKVYEMRRGESHEATIREVIAKGWGNAYDKLEALECWPRLKAKYEAEMANPLLALTGRFNEAYKRKIKAKWWLETGLGITYGPPTDAQEENARADYAAATAALEEASNRHDDHIRALDDRWDAVAPLLQRPDGVKMKLIGYGCVPHYPWPSEDRTITIDFTDSYPFLNQRVTYPEDTILQFNYTTSLSVENHWEIKAIIAGDRCIQLLPSIAVYERVEDWVIRFPRTVRARFTVTLPAA